MLADDKLHVHMAALDVYGWDPYQLVKVLNITPAQSVLQILVILKAGVKTDLHFHCLVEVSSCWPMLSLHHLEERFVLSGSGSQCHPNSSALNPFIKTMVGKLRPAPNLCDLTAKNVTFLNGWEKSKEELYFMTQENHMNFKFQCQ